MPRYHFNIHDHTFYPDMQGQEIFGLGAAQREAMVLACTVLTRQNDLFWDGSKWKVSVTDPVGTVLFELHLFASEMIGVDHGAFPV